MGQQSTDFSDLLFEVRNGIGRATFNRPQARNAFTFEMYERLAQICEQADKDRSIKVLVLQGAGDKAFASGTDINQFRAFKTPEHAIEYESRLDRVLATLEQCRVPTIAAIAGACTGGGAGIAPAAICAWGRKRQDSDFRLPAHLAIAFRCRASAGSPP
jgi:enoyl-CoA hydratase